MILIFDGISPLYTYNVDGKLADQDVWIKGEYKKAASIVASAIVDQIDKSPTKEGKALETFSFEAVRSQIEKEFPGEPLPRSIVSALILITNSMVNNLQVDADYKVFGDIPLENPNKYIAYNLNGSAKVTIDELRAIAKDGTLFTKSLNEKYKKIEQDLKTT